MSRSSPRVNHPRIPRRVARQVGAAGLSGLEMNHVAGLRALAAERNGAASPRPKSVIYIFLSGSLTQHDSFGPKPQAPDTIRGEFAPIVTRTAGVRICEHLPKLAARSDKWALVRSLTHPYNEHSIGRHVILMGRTPIRFMASRDESSPYHDRKSLRPSRSSLPTSGSTVTLEEHGPAERSTTMTARNASWRFQRLHSQ